MSACGQSAFGMLPAKSAPMKKGQKRFEVGTPVKFKIWQGGVYEFVGEVVRDGKPMVWVNSFGRAFEIRREALTVIKGGEK